MARIVLYVSDEMRRRLEKISKSKGHMSLSETARQALEKFVDEELKKLQEVKTDA